MLWTAHCCVDSGLPNLQEFRGIPVTNASSPEIALLCVRLRLVAEHDVEFLDKHRLLILRHAELGCAMHAFGSSILLNICRSKVRDWNVSHRK